MNDIYLGILTVVLIIGLLELFKSLEKRLVASLTLVGIAFIYIGFCWQDILSLAYTIIGVALFLNLSYFGYKKNFNLIILGLVLHGIWDVLFPYVSLAVPEGYDVFCLTVDLLLAAYFYLRVKPKKIEVHEVAYSNT